MFFRPYDGEFEGSALERKLSLPDPILPCGDVPAGFMGYAVNFIDLTDHNIINATGRGLRETLFYRLFGELQVYETRRDMINARSCIRHGAISLDGGIIKENGIISLGHGYVYFSLALFLMIVKIFLSVVGCGVGKVTGMGLLSVLSAQ